MTAPSAQPSSPPKRRRWLRWLFAFILLVVAAVGVMAWLGYSRLKGSLPRQSGELFIAGLQAPVQIERDNLGVPAIRAQFKNDLALALGFLHGQERYFQMDLMRRDAAGELAALFGPGKEEVIVKRDKSQRMHRFRSRAKEAAARLTPEERTWLERYAVGVNAGLALLDSKPFEYELLGVEPQPWLLEDSFLMVAAMYLALQPEIWQKEGTLAAVTDLYPPEVSRWLGHPSDEWDTPLEGGPIPLPPLPTSEQLNLRFQGIELPPAERSLPATQPLHRGSNSWAVAGSKSAVGPLLCNDMHLDLRLPNIWYRACFYWPDEKLPGKTRRAVGVTLPGAPVLVVGSNGDVAWGYTNAQADWADLVLLESVPEDPNLYLTPTGRELYKSYNEVIQVKGQPDQTVRIVETIWGPLVGEGDHKKRQRALRWVAYDPECMNLKMRDLLEARSLEEAMATANRIGGPHQNFLVAAKDGRIGWTLLGRIPNRKGFDGRIPMSWANGRYRWDGYLPPEQAPRIIGPANGVLWTANNRLVSGSELEKVGIGDYDRGARARQIRDGLLKLATANYDDMLAIHLDDRALFLDRWQKLLVKLLSEENLKDQPNRARYKERLEQWGGRATPESVGFRLVLDFRLRTQRRVLDALTARCRLAQPTFDAVWLPQPEGILWRLVTEKPMHLLEGKYKDWDTLLLAVVDEQLAELTPDDPELVKSTWGEVNRADIHHVLSGELGPLGSYLGAPPDPLPGCKNDMPRILGPRVGASERLAVSPGREEEGYFHMPGGQSGHPLSPHFLDGHEAWVKGSKTPLLPGEPVHRLELKPKS